MPTGQRMKSWEIAGRSRGRGHAAPRLAEEPLPHRLRWYLAVAAATFIAAALVHRGILLQGYQHARAFLAESIIAAVLLAGLVVSLVAPHRTRTAALAALGFALLGVIAGLIAITAGVGPQSTPDLVYHILIVLLLAAGLAEAARQPQSDEAHRPWHHESDYSMGRHGRPS